MFTLRTPPPPRSTLFPYTTLFRSVGVHPVHRPRRGQKLHRPSCAGDVDGTLAGAGWGRVPAVIALELADRRQHRDRKSTRLNSSHPSISYAVFCLKKKNNKIHATF